MPRRLAQRVLLIGWDAADWQMIDPLLQAGLMPCLKSFLAEGVRGNIATLNPILSPILWNSIATGKRADKHDILGFMEPDGKGYVRPVTSTSRKVKAVWNILSQHGLQSSVVSWFASYPAEKIKGCVITDRYYRVDPEFREQYPLDERTVYPASLLPVLDELRIDTGDILGEQAEFFAPRIREVDPQKDIRAEALARLLAECSSVHNMSTWLLEHQPFDLMAVYYDAIDHFGHAFMPYHPPRMDHVSETDGDIFGGVMNAAYRLHDLLLARLLHLAGPDTTVIILSDHGFQSGNLRPRLFWSEQAGKLVGAGANPVAWHRPYGVFAARGPGIRKGQEINGATLLDICPTILTLLGLPVADDMDGVPLLHIFEDPPQVARVATYEPPHPDDGIGREAAEDDPYATDMALRQLVELGYIAAPPEDRQQLVKNAILDRKSNLAQVYYSSGRIAEAEGLLRELAAEAPGPEFRTRLAMCLIHQERFAEADEILSELSADETQAPVAMHLRSHMRYGQQRYDEAAELLQKVIDFGVRFQQVHTQMGLIRVRQGRWADAEASYRRAIEIDADDAEAHDGLGIALREQGRSEDAVYQHMRAISLLAHRAESHINLGVALADCNKVDWAIRAFETAAGLAPDNPFPHRCLSQIYRKAKKDPEAARRHIRTAVELRSRLQERAREDFLKRPTW